LISPSSRSASAYLTPASGYSPEASEVVLIKAVSRAVPWSIFAVSIFLVSVPVFIQAPLVRFLPGLSLVLTAFFWWISAYLSQYPNLRHWGSLLSGFAWTWLAGSIYWGWFRWEPVLHLPIEAIGLPFAMWGILRQRHQVGHLFFLGSFLGTAITDLYFYLVNLIPHWRELMKADLTQVQPIFQSAIAQMETPWGMSWALMLASLLLFFGLAPLRFRQLHWWAFSGAVLSTILVDCLFWLTALVA
jgi:hypothetical protein